MKLLINGKKETVGMWSFTWLTLLSLFLLNIIFVGGIWMLYLIIQLLLKI